MIVPSLVTVEKLYEIVKELHPKSFYKKLELYENYVSHGVAFSFSDDSGYAALAGVRKLSEEVGLYWGAFHPRSRKHKRPFLEYADGLISLGFQALELKVIKAFIDEKILRDVLFIKRLNFDRTEECYRDKQIYILEQEKVNGKQ